MTAQTLELLRENVQARNEAPEEKEFEPLHRDFNDKADRDAGDLARSAWRAKQKRAFLRFVSIFMIWLLALAVVAGFTYYRWNDIVNYVLPDYDKYAQDLRPCIFKVGERTITGQRSYEYRYMTLFNHKIVMTPSSEVQQETRLDITGNGMTILGSHAGAAPDKLIISDGERYRQLLKRADDYTFFMDGGKNTAIVAYSDICK